MVDESLRIGPSMDPLQFLAMGYSNTNVYMFQQGGYFIDIWFSLE